MVTGGSFPGCSDGKKSTFNARELSLIPGSRVGNGNPLQYSCLGNYMDRRAWQATVQKLYVQLIDGHLEPDILECEVKWALGSITTNKASGYDGIPVELFQILIDDAVKVLHSICQQMENSAVATGMENVSFHSNPKEKQC